ncbi:hypothetical protein ACFZBM_30875 [Streptomyces lavendulae]|uniref:Uncharacterized protein n=1 Tax=Streptomyces lavendulae subsp. lavendulae TaxID=58340 RepID=A0A2K8PUK8_STRLA|nr:hypothetical protein SLAV_37905 [Streptomyces lavendulae subsp. lavendulae]QUQ59155.1 hypothetical protein SLLC_36045 [Streptomyces lavendulae subsp. lavendulae]
MEEDRSLRAAFCAAMSWLNDVMASEGRGDELRSAARAVRAGTTTVRQAIAGLGIPEHVLAGARVRRAGRAGATLPDWCRIPPGRRTCAPTDGAV